MNHRIVRNKLGRTGTHVRAMLSNMAVALIKHEQIKTTLPKAKVLRPYVEKLVTKAKNGYSLQAYRQLLSVLHDAKIVKKLFDVMSPRYKQRHGGYTRIMKAGYRHGDNAPVAYIEFVDHSLQFNNNSTREDEAA